MKRCLPILLLLATSLAACDSGDLPKDLSGTASPAGPGASTSPDKASARGPGKGVLLELRRWKDPEDLVLIGKGSVLSGPAGGPLVRTVFSGRERAEDLRSFVRTYAPFRAPLPGGEVAFHGQGRARPGPVERRMIAEWARAVAAETAGAQGDSSYGLVLSWHRSGGAGICDEVTVDLTGEARASSCSWDHEARGRLAPATLARLYEWFDELAPFQSGGGDEDLSGGTQSGLIFAGRGKREATPAEIARMQALPPALFRELSGRAPVPAAPDAPAGMTSAPPPPPGEAPAGLPPGTRLLLPPRHTVRTGPRPGTEVVLQFPEEPPPVPLPPSPPAAPPTTTPGARPATPAGPPPPAGEGG
ncbi:MAG TPA: hypothetical protein VJ725_25425 [Thermoanaerobaculia bacterium]|nr:hypothetical protein [Thermoanaerobaculia bacterium]